MLLLQEGQAKSLLRDRLANVDKFLLCHNLTFGLLMLGELDIYIRNVGCRRLLVR